MKKLILIMSASFVISGALSAKEKLTYVNLGFIEGLSLADSNSSERYRRAFEDAIFYAIGENEKKLNQCGYRYRVLRNFFDASDTLGAKKAGKEVEEKGAWIIFGPRRSEDFLKMIEGSSNSVNVSPMAEAAAVHKLPPPTFTMYPTMIESAVKLAEVIKQRKYGKKYAAIIDATCPACRDFEVAFDEIAKQQGMQKVFSLDVTKDLPSMPPILAKLEKTPVDFILLPNTSKLSGFLITNISKKFPSIRYVGTNGWGDPYYGFLSKFGIDDGVEGFATRSGLPYEAMKNKFRVQSLDSEWMGELIGPNFTAHAAIHFIRKLSDDLCRLKPTQRAHFLSQMKKQKTDHFKMPVGLSVVEIAHGKLQFETPKIQIPKSVDEFRSQK